MVETTEAACIPALEALPPSVLSLEAGVGSWLQAEGTDSTVQRTMTRPMATSRIRPAEPVDVSKCKFTRILLLQGEPGCTLLKFFM